MLYYELCLVLHTCTLCCWTYISIRCPSFTPCGANAQPYLASTTPQLAQCLLDAHRSPFLACLHPQLRRLYGVVDASGLSYFVLYQPAVASIRLYASPRQTGPYRNHDSTVPVSASSYLTHSPCRLVDISAGTMPVLASTSSYLRHATARFVLQSLQALPGPGRPLATTRIWPPPSAPPLSPSSSWFGALSVDTPLLHPACAGIMVFIYHGTLRHQICFFSVHSKKITFWILHQVRFETKPRLCCF
ncbi:hypothetical protein J3F83DRAFT_515820 [Trichoderma novae-zelandiae]